MSTPRLYVTVDPVNDAAFVRGWNARELIVNCGGRPLWSRTRRAWSTCEGTAVDVAALAGAEGYDVSYVEQRRDAS